MDNKTPRVGSVSRGDSHSQTYNPLARRTCATASGAAVLPIVANMAMANLLSQPAGTAPSQPASIVGAIRPPIPGLHLPETANLGGARAPSASRGYQRQMERVQHVEECGPPD